MWHLPIRIVIVTALSMLTLRLLTHIVAALSVLTRIVAATLAILTRAAL